MAFSRESCEQMLIASYTRQEQLYQNALDVARVLQHNHKDGCISEVQLAPLTEIFAELAELERSMGDAKQFWQTTNQHAEGRFKHQLKRVEDAMTELLHIVRALETHAEKHRTSLLPEIDAAARATRMKRAYGSL